MKPSTCVKTESISSSTTNKLWRTTHVEEHILVLDEKLRKEAQVLTIQLWSSVSAARGSIRSRAYLGRCSVNLPDRVCASLIHLPSRRTPVLDNALLL